MTNLQLAAQQALEALQSDPNAMVKVSENYWDYKRDLAITALKQALSGHGQKPAGWQWLDTANYRKRLPANAIPGHWRPLYTAPARQPKPLTEEEIVRLMVGQSRAKLMFTGKKDPEFLRFAEEAIRELVDSARAIERAHGIG